MADIRLTRTHAILDVRRTQIGRNIAAWRGGWPYIDMALTRYRCEPDVSWSGDMERGIASRKDRTSYINYAGRIVSKINQYVFGQDVERPDADEAFLEDATACGMSLPALMEDASALVTTAGWCWLHADRVGGPVIDPDTGAVRRRSLAERERDGDRVFWQLWRPDEVVDWHFGPNGRLEWLITEQSVYDNSNVLLKPKTRMLRTIWMRGTGTRLWYEGEKIEGEEAFAFAGDRVPFVPIGLPTDKPWWFDDVERVQAGLLNLESSHLESLFEAVFPQLVLPADMPKNLMTLLELDGPAGRKVALEMTRGLTHPILESPESRGLSRYITPDQSNLKALPDEILRRRRELFEVVGLAMANKDTAQVASAESKAWDHLDPAAVMRARAQKLEEAERKMVDLSVDIDPQFQAYEPSYPRTFNMIEFESDVKAVTELDQSVTTPELRRELERYKALLVMHMISVPPERRKAILDEIAEADMEPRSVTMPNEMDFDFGPRVDSGASDEDA